jgi:hypothetical protein
VGPPDAQACPSGSSTSRRAETLCGVQAMTVSGLTMISCERQSAHKGTAKPTVVGRLRASAGVSSPSVAARRLGAGAQHSPVAMQREWADAAPARKIASHPEIELRTLRMRCNFHDLSNFVIFETDSWVVGLHTSDRFTNFFIYLWTASLPRPPTPEQSETSTMPRHHGLGCSMKSASDQSLQNRRSATQNSRSRRCSRGCGCFLLYTASCGRRAADSSAGRCPITPKRRK